MNVIARLEYELAYYESAVRRFYHYTTRTPPRPCEGIHRSTSLLSLSLLLKQFPACLVSLIRIVFVMGGRWPFSCCLVGCWQQHLFNTACSIFVQLPSNLFFILLSTYLFTYLLRKVHLDLINHHHHHHRLVVSTDFLDSLSLAIRLYLLSLLAGLLDYILFPCRTAEDKF